MMNRIIKITLAASLAFALALVPDTSFAQSRGGGGSRSSSSVSRSSSGGGASRSASPSRSSGPSRSSSVGRSSSSGRSSASVSRPSSSSRSSASVSRPSSSSQNRQGSVSRSTSQQRSTGRSSASVSRPSSSSQNRQGSVSRSTSQSRSTAGRTVTPSRSSSQSRQPAQVGRSTARSSSQPAQVGRSSSQPNRTTTQPSRQPGSNNAVRPQRQVTPARPNGTVGGPRPGERPGSRGDLRPERRQDHGPRIHPRERDFIEHGRSARFFHRGPHLFGYRVHILPTHYVRRVFWGIDYYICDGIYYRFWDGCYHICRPPFGIRFNRALYDLELVLCDFAFYSTVNRVYRQVNDNYETIAEQNAIIAQNNATIAAQNNAISNGSRMADESYNLASRLGLFQSYANAGKQYYYDDGIFFIEGADGQYETIIPPAGALISELPDDYEVVVLDGQEYYRVDDTIYRTVVVNNKALFEVLGQIN